LACCRLCGHEDKIVTKETESGQRGPVSVGLDKQPAVEHDLVEVSEGGVEFGLDRRGLVPRGKGASLMGPVCLHSWGIEALQLLDLDAFFSLFSRLQRAGGLENSFVFSKGPSRPQLSLTL
jgi:hypothetical protein